MNLSKKLFLISMVLIFIGVLGSVFAYTLQDTETYAEEKKIEENFTDISIDVNNEDMEFLSTSKTEARVEIEGLDSKNLEEQVTIEVKEDTLFIETVSDTKLLNINFFPNDVKLTVHLPEKEYESFMLKTDNGDFHAMQLEMESVRVDTNNGNIELEDVTSETVNATSDNGIVKMTRVEGAISGTSNNGAISLFTKDFDNPIDLETDNGNIEIIAEKEPTNATFDITTDNGEVSLFGENDLNETFGDGENLIELTTDNGNITVSK